MSFFVDTNVLVYARDAGEDDKRRRAQEWIAALWASRRGRTGVQVLNEFYVTVTRRMRPPAPALGVQAEIRELLRWDPIDMDSAIIETAWAVQERFGFSYWDSLIVAAAQIAGCDYLLTEDLSDGQELGSVTVVDPFAHEPASLI